MTRAENETPRERARERERSERELTRRAHRAPRRCFIQIACERVVAQNFIRFSATCNKLLFHFIQIYSVIMRAVLRKISSSPEACVVKSLFCSVRAKIYTADSPSSEKDKTRYFAKIPELRHRGYTRRRAAFTAYGVQKRTRRSSIAFPSGTSGTLNSV